METVGKEKSSLVHTDPAQPTSKPPSNTADHVPRAGSKTPQKKHRWYLGGLASAGAASVTHPLDLLKVNFSYCV